MNALARFVNARKELIISVEGSADRVKDGAGISEKEPEKETSDQKLRTEEVQQKDSSMENASDDTQLRRLAKRRADRVQEYMTRQGKVAANRIQLNPVRVKESFNKDDGAVELFLSAE